MLRCVKTHCEEHKVLLVVFSDTVVHPGTVVVHLFDAAFTHTVDTQFHKCKDKDDEVETQYFQANCDLLGQKTNMNIKYTTLLRG